MEDKIALFLGGGIAFIFGTLAYNVATCSHMSSICPSRMDFFLAIAY